MRNPIARSVFLLAVFLLAAPLVSMASAGDGITPLTGPSWTFETNQPNARLAFVRAAGDVNGDGFGDVIASAPLFDTSNVGAGRAWVFLGSKGGLSSTPAWQSSGPDQAGARFGSFVSAAGDVDGDGYDDVLVVANGYDDPEVDEGVVYLYRGGPNGLAPTPAWAFEGGHPGRQITSAAYAGDLNHDGYADVIVGAIDPSGAGVVFLFHGRAQGLSSTPSWTLDGTQLGLAIGSQLGSSVSTAGDVNADGYDDFLVGAALAPDPATAAGEVFLFLGGSTLPSTTPAWTASGGAVGDAFGSNGNFGAAGDVNGDGYADVIVGAGGVGNDDHGAVYVFHGSASGLSAAATLVGLQSAARFGDGASAAGDVNGDGFADVWIGSPFFTSASATVGRVELHLGGASGVASTAVATFDGSTFGSAVGSELGSFVAPVGDVNGDGFADVAVVAPLFDHPELDEGKGWILDGCARGLLATPVWTAAGGRGFGETLGAGDVDGDGFSDLAVGAAASGYYGQVELFRGTPNGPATAASWAVTSTQLFDGFGRSVAVADVNGDGFADLVVGAPFYTNGQTHEGAAFLYLGGPAGISPTPAWSTESDQANAMLGTTVAIAGDVNGDGFADLLVAAPYHTGTYSNAGRVLLFLGSAAGLSTAPSWTYDGDHTGAQAGLGLSSAGDVNGDGFADVLVMTQTGTYPARADLFEGSITGLANASSWSVPIDTYYGTATAAGDVNGDGFDDVISSSPPRVFLGGPSGPGLAPAWTNGATWTYRVASAGDVNGDGFSDVILADPEEWVGGQPYLIGEAFVFLGGPGGPASTPQWHVAGTDLFSLADLNFGLAITCAGDVNGDGISDIAVGAPELYCKDSCNVGHAAVFLGNFGGGPALLPEQRRSDDSAQIAPFGKSEVTSAFRVSAEPKNPGGFSSTIAGRGSVRLQWEVKEQRVAFDGADVRASPSSIDSGAIGTHIVLGELASGLTQGRTYHWRERIATADPVFKHSRWLSAPVLCSSGTMLRTFRDCNGNAVPDDDDIAHGTSADTNADGVPDECEGVIAGFCFGDGSGLSCPCANNGASGNGCANSANALGAHLGASGIPSASHDTLVLHGSGMPASSSVLYFQGTTPIAGGSGAPFGDGLRCAGGSVIRLGIESNAGGASSYPGAGGDPPISVKGAIPPQGGVTRLYQAWYRDAALFCTSSAFDLTNGVSASWSP